jgi:hypothetical protein
MLRGNRGFGTTVDGFAAVYDLGHGIDPVLSSQTEGEREIVRIVFQLGRHLILLPD